MKEINKLVKEIHQNAIEHGWWEDERSFSEIAALIHSELSEALEEYRNNTPLFYLGANGKPEGIAVELADSIIRILDYCGYKNINVRESIDSCPIKPNGLGVPELVVKCHYLISQAYEEEGVRPLYFTKCINLIKTWCKENDVDIETVIHTKHEYNKTRPYRHGGKAC